MFIVIIIGLYFRYLLKSIKFVSYSYHIFIANIAIGKWGPVLTCDFVCFLFLNRLKRIFAVMILWSDDTPSKAEYASQLQTLFIHFLFLII